MISTNIFDQNLVLLILAVFGENGLQFVGRRMIWAACAIESFVVRTYQRFLWLQDTIYLYDMCRYKRQSSYGFRYDFLGLFSMMSIDEDQHKVS